jgi:hypothetical protein
MRVTKAELQRRLDLAEGFQKCEILVVRDSDIEKLRLRSGFVSAEQYGHGQIPMWHEIGRVGMKRFICKKLAKWEPGKVEVPQRGGNRRAAFRAGPVE